MLGCRIDVIQYVSASASAGMKVTHVSHETWQQEPKKGYSRKTVLMYYRIFSWKKEGGTFPSRTAVAKVVVYIEE